jgi:hypothetical protein
MSNAWVATLELLKLGGQCLHLSFQFSQALEEVCLGLAGRFQEATFRSVSDELSAIQLQSLDLKGPCLAQRL